jgi:hypothetical protein
MLFVGCVLTYAGLQGQTLTLSLIIAEAMSLPKNK